MQTDKSHIVYLGLGSNIGNRRLLIKEAIGLLGERVGEVVRQSSLMETEPWGFSSPNMFLNACVACHTEFTPREVLTVTQQVEKEMGRLEKSKDNVYHDRTIDIDILLYDDISIHEPGLVIPHPRMKEREFVMKPLSEIYPDMSSL
jgi:2-amino-4-hydroxy-6-hydroxymethyldihydropteridine diphosphokinase